MNLTYTELKKKDSPFIFCYKMLIILLLILGMNGVITSYYGVEIDIVIFVLCVGLCFINNSIIRNVDFVFLLFLLLYLALSSFITSTNLFYYIGLYGRVLIGAILLTGFKHDYKDLRIYLNKGLWVVCYISFVNLLLFSFAPSAFHINEFPSGRVYYSIAYIFNYLPPAPHELFIRNQGIFFEPGVLQIFVNLLLLDELILKKRSIFSVWFPILIIFSTFSTTGFILTLFIIAWRILFVGKRTKYIFRRIFLLSVFIICVLPIVWINFENKFVGEGASSSALRLYDFTMGLNIIGDKPLFGIGMDLSRYFKYNTLADMEFYSDYNINLDRGNTNTLMMVGIHLGLPMLFLYLNAILKQKIYPCKWAFFIVFTIACSTEPIAISVFNSVIVLSALKPFSKKCIRFNSYGTPC